MSREFLYIVQESAYKTPLASPVVGTSSIYIRLDGSNAMKGRPKPITAKVPYGGGLAVNAFTISDKLQTKFTISTLLYASQANFLLQWAGSRINAGQTTPWTTTEPAGDLASCAVYHAIQRSDGSYKRRVYLGTKVDSWSFEVGEDSTDARLTLSCTASTPQGNQFDSSTDPTALVFPAPTDAQLPTDPFLFIHSSGLLTIGTARAQCSRVKIESKNKFGGKYFANRFLQLYRWLGRETSFEADNLYAATPDDRTAFEGLTAQSVSFELNNTTHTATFTLNAQNVFDSLEDDLKLDDLYFENSSIANQWDNTAGSDLTIATT